MTKLLLKLFVKDYQNTKAPAVRTAYGRLSGVVGIACNALLSFAKLFMGLLTGSIAIMADAVNNFSDMASSVITLIGFKLSAKPADKEHPFGHARFEYVAALAVAVMVAAIGIDLGRNSITKIITPAETVFTTASIIVLALSIIVKLWMAFFNKALGKAINSDALKATAEDSRNDCISTGAVLVAAILSRVTGWQTDGVIGLAVAVFIIISGIRLIKSTLDPILGTAPGEETVQYVKDKISAYDGVLGTHDLIMHDYGPGRRFASAHVEMSSDVDVLVSHDIIDNIERDFLERDNLHLIIHYDPIVTGNSALNTARGRLDTVVKSIDKRLSIHDFRMVDGPSHTNYIFDIVLPHGSGLSREELKKRIDEQLQDGGKPVNTVITFDDSYSPIP